MASSYMIPSRPSLPALTFFFTSSVFRSNIVDVESPAFVVKPMPAFGANAMPCTRGVSLMSPNDLSRRAVDDHDVRCCATRTRGRMPGRR